MVTNQQVAQPAAPGYPMVQQTTQPTVVAQPAQEEVYPYDYGFQRYLLALAVQDPSFLAANRECLVANYFEDRVLRFVAQSITAFFDQYGQLPQYTPLIEYLGYQLHAKNRGDLAQPVAELAYFLYAQPVPNADYIKDRAVHFARRQALKRAVLHAVEVLRKDADPSTVLTAVQQSMSIGQAQDTGSDFADMAPQLGEMWKAMQASRGSIRTMILPSFDNALFGGPRRGELYVIQAVPKCGKSMFLVNFGATAITQGYRVLHVTIGDLKEYDVHLRYGARLSGWPMDQIMENNPGYVQTVRQLGLQQQRLIVKYYQPYSLTAAQLRSYMSWLYTTKGYQPDMLIIDYPDKFLFDRSQTYSEMGRIYMEIKQLLDDFNCVGWIASQSNRGAAQAALNTTANMAESWDKLANADGVCPITMEERNNVGQGKVTFYAENLRFGADHLKLNVAFDFRNCGMVEDSEQTKAATAYNQNMNAAQVAATQSYQQATMVAPAGQTYVQPGTQMAGAY